MGLFNANQNEKLKSILTNLEFSALKQILKQIQRQKFTKRSLIELAYLLCFFNGFTI
jgi:hypothetical protein